MLSSCNSSSVTFSFRSFDFTLDEVVFANSRRCSASATPVCATRDVNSDSVSDNNVWGESNSNNAPLPST